MEIMNMLEGDALEGLRMEFGRSHEDGIEMVGFVKVMIEKLLESEKVPEELRSPDKLIPEMTKLFEEIDRNGNGRVEWAEFTGYCVDAGFVATRRFVEPLRFSYVEDIQYKDTTSRGSKISRLLFLEPIQRVASLEKDSMVLKLYDSNLKLVSQLDVHERTSHVRPLKADLHRYGGIITCLVSNGKRPVLIVIAADLSVTFWDAHTLKLLSYGFNKNQQLAMSCNPKTKILYTGGVGQRVLLWNINTGKSFDHIMTKHTERITDMLILEDQEILITASNDKTIHLYDTLTYHCKAVLEGHTCGVLGLVYSHQQNVLLSYGMEKDAYGWDVVAHKQILALRGHRATIVGINLLPASGVNRTDRAITADALGNFRIWDFRHAHTGFGTCLQVFQRKIRTVNGKVKEKCDCTIKTAPAWNVDDFSPTTFCITKPSFDVITAAAKMFRFTASQCINMDNLPNAALYNASTMSFITIMGKDVQIWNADTGCLEEEMFGISPSELTTAVLDDRDKKFILGTADGTQYVHNYLNGIKMKWGEYQHEADITALYYVGREMILISVARDRQILIHDEIEEDEEAPFIRSITNAHHSDILCVDYSGAYSLMATGSADRSVNIWDFEFLKLYTQIGSHEADVVSVAFVGDYPLLASADSSGAIYFHLVFPTSEKGKCVYCWENWNDIAKHGDGYYCDLTQTSKTEPFKVGINALQIKKVLLGKTKGPEWVLVIGDDMGVIKMLSLEPLIQYLGLSERPKQEFPHNRTGYNARRRLTRDATLHVQQDSRSWSSKKHHVNGRKYLRVKTTIKAHSASVNTLQLIEDPCTVLSSSMDRSVKIHCLLTGEQLGVLNMSDEEREAIATGEKPDHPWKFDTGPSKSALADKMNKRNNQVRKSLETLEKEEQAAVEKERALASAGLKRKQEKEQSRLKLQARDKRRSLVAQNSFSSMEDFNEKAKLKQDLLSQLSEAGSSSPNKLAKQRVYEHFFVEQYRHPHITFGQQVFPTTNLQKVDIEPSEFLKYQLGFGHENKLRALKSKKLESLSKFRRRFAPARLMESTVLADDDSVTSATSSTTSKMPRPKTAPFRHKRDRLITTILDPQERVNQWEASNLSFLEQVDALLEPNVNIAALQETNATSTAQLLQVKRPSTAKPIIKNEEIEEEKEEEQEEQDLPGREIERSFVNPSLKQKNWRRKSTLVMNKFESIVNGNAEPPIAAPVPVVGKKKPKRRKSLVQQQIEYGRAVRKSLIGSSKRLGPSRVVSQEGAKVVLEKTRVSATTGKRETQFCTMFGPYSDAKIEMLYKMFKQFDPNNSGSIDMQEFYTSEEWKRSPLVSSLVGIFDALDTNGDQEISMDEFLSAFCPLASSMEINEMVKYLHKKYNPQNRQIIFETSERKLSSSAQKEITELFRLLDKDCDGFINIEDLKILKGTNKILDMEDLEQLIKTHCKTGENRLNLASFMDICKEYFLCDSEQLVREVLLYNNQHRHASSVISH